MRNYSLEQIRKSYTQKKSWEKQFPVNYFLVRPLSFYLTYLVLKVTQNPAIVAFFGFILGMVGCLFLAGSCLWSIWPGILLIALYSISDAIDGNIARTTGNVTLFGRYLDGILGDLIDGSYFFFLGIGLYLLDAGSSHQLVSLFGHEYARMVPLLSGSVILICRLWAAGFETRYDIYRIRKQGSAAHNPLSVTAVTGISTFSNRWYYLIFINLSSLNNQLLLLVLLTVLGMEIWFLVFFACFFAGKALLYFVFFFNKTRSTLLEDRK